MLAGMFTVWLPGKKYVSSGTFSGKPVQVGDFIQAGGLYGPYYEVLSTQGARVVIEESPRWSRPMDKRILRAT